MLNVILYSAIAGIVGMVLGSVFSLFIINRAKTFTGMLLRFSAGIMIAIVCFELIPEAIGLAGVWIAALSVLVGAAVVPLIGKFVHEDRASSLMKTGIMLLVATAIHNLPEGLAIGASTVVGSELVFSLLVGVHNVPEGIAISAPLQMSGMKNWKTLLLVAACGAVTVIGAIAGYFVGELSPVLATVAMGLAAGAMLFVVWDELLPESKELYDGKLSTLILITGIVAGLLLVFLLGE